MGVKLNARQQAQLAYLQGLTPKFQKIHSTIELMANMQADESVVRSFGRTLDEIKSGAGQMSLNGLAETAGLMSTMAAPRRRAADEDPGTPGAVWKPENQLRRGSKGGECGGWREEVASRRP